ncbi:hypothetical protein, variant 1 [Aphanomyces astaci]|uniref:Acid phosphatase n=1 Tax=Aphanomyces astaci TaxID=112090 RepID=W4FYA0_APHAT|nr:hypothetical protein, variant 1 [Aphanomyces astaci]ETV72467.1 hypothetical protein, variant 1 [Aphanomyces astaci]|eukprot:XP_009838149.1 hypothetical protein, variant 1 [Aphanomyces astaci]
MQVIKSLAPCQHKMECKEVKIVRARRGHLLHMKAWAVYLCLTAGHRVAATEAFADYAYCSKHVEQNVIAPLDNPDQYTLQQVQIVMRHGARTLAARSSCWTGYNVTWSCNAKMRVSPQLDGDSNPHHVYEMRYMEGETELKGNCHVGQLLDEGYAQEFQNGRTFRTAYIDAGALFPASNPADLSNPDDIFLSSTDMHRTVMSGQLVVDAMFPPPSSSAVVPWHVGDIALSSYVPNPTACPKLVEIKAQFEASPGYVAWMANQSAVVDLTRATFQSYDARMLFDCLVTSRCSQPQSLPHLLSSSHYDQIVTYERDKRMKIYVDSDAVYAKASIAKVMLAIRNRMLLRVRGGANTSRFALYSGHDDTVMPLLAALGGSQWLQDWPPYAAYLSFELYENNSGSHFVRFVYQGQPLTVPGCQDDKLCPLDVFTNMTAFATDKAICAASLKVAVKPVQSESFDVGNDEDVDTQVSFKALVLFVFVGLLLGVVFGLIMAQTLAKNGQPKHTSIDKGPAKSTFVTIQSPGNQRDDDCQNEDDTLLLCQSPKHKR